MQIDEGQDSNSQQQPAVTDKNVAAIAQVFRDSIPKSVKEECTDLTALVNETDFTDFMRKA